MTVRVLVQDAAACLDKFVVFDDSTIRSRPLLRPVGDGNN